MKIHRILLLIIFAIFTISLNAQNRIVGGQDASINDYPWQVALSMGCGGSIISDEWVLTASHCVDATYASWITVTVGSSDYYASGGDEYGVSEIILHPNWNGEASNGYDIALLRIDGRIEFKDGVQPIEIITPDQLDLEAPGVMATATGWGALESGGNDSGFPLQSVQLPIISNDVACGAQVDDNGNSVIKEVHLFGGETLLSQRLPSLLRMIDPDVSLTLSTNCTIYKPEVFDLLSRLNRVDFMLSIDGPGVNLAEPPVLLNLPELKPAIEPPPL